MKLRSPDGEVHNFVNEFESWYTKCGALFAKFDCVDDTNETTCKKCKELENG